jgi:hypothetical protein
MAAPFRFLSVDEFERLNSAEKLAYLSDAMAELERVNVPREVRGWNSLFRHQQQQQQQQQQPPQQPQPGEDTEPPAEK